jgi:putative isomerase
MDALAQNFLDTNAEKLNRRDSELLARAVQTLHANTVGPEQMPWAPHRGIIPSFGTYRGVWNWDAAFHALAVARWDPKLAWEQLQIFVDHQQSDGAFVDVLFATGDIVSDFGKPPVWPWAVRLMEEHLASVGDLQTAYDRFVRLEEHWLQRRCVDGLFHYDTAGRDGDWLQQVKYESGWDNSVRWDNGIVEIWPVDLNCFMVGFYEAMDWIAAKLGIEGTGWLQKRDALSGLIEEFLWDPRLRAYVDHNYETSQPTGVLTVASFMPLFAGTASKERAARMGELAASEKHFFPGLPTVSYMNAGYSRDMWRGPCWLNTAYFALKGLQRYGFTETADAMRDTILGWCWREEHLREYYDAKTGEGLAAVDFGWTAAFVVELVLDW